MEYSKLFSNDNNNGFNTKKIVKKKIMDMIFNYSILDISMHPSENYVLILNDKKQILINNIKENKITAVIDLNSQINKIYNIQMDISGLYLAIICNIKSNNRNIKRKTDLILVEINSSKLQNFILENNPINKVSFDNEGKYIIIGGEYGEISLWRLPGDISSKIKNFLSDVNYDENFWDTYEIKYSRFLNNNIININNNNDITLTSNNYNNINNYNNESEYLSSNNNNENNNSSEDTNYNNFSSNYSEIKNKNKRSNNRLSKSMTAKMSHKNYFIMNTREKINKYKENGMSRNEYKYSSRNNIDLSSDINNMKFKNKIRYNFWSNSDTINIKKSINLQRHNKFPEPKDIDDYLLK